MLDSPSSSFVQTDLEHNKRVTHYNYAIWNLYMWSPCNEYHSCSTCTWEYRKLISQLTGMTLKPLTAPKTDLWTNRAVVKPEMEQNRVNRTTLDDWCCFARYLVLTTSPVAPPAHASHCSNRYRSWFKFHFNITYIVLTETEKSIKAPVQLLNFSARQWLYSLHKASPHSM